MVKASCSVKADRTEGVYLFEIASLDDQVAVSASNGSWGLYDKENLRQVLTIESAHANVSSIKPSKDNKGVFTCGTEGDLKFWDIRTECKNPANTWHVSSPILSLAVANHGNFIATGSELYQNEAPIYLWDIRNTSPVRSWNDSHNDDVTTMEFLPKSKELLLSASTDGLINITDVTKDENAGGDADEEAVLHVINHGASLHIATFLSRNRILAVSHMESYAFYKLKRETDSWKSKAVTTFDDLRPKLDCSYVIGTVATDDKRKHMLAYSTFDNPTVRFANIDRKTGVLNPTSSVQLDRMSGEICRDVVYDKAHHVYFTASEDGFLQAFSS
ncbi:WDR89 family WD repeat protein [Schizosaccharomyces japonicus yFS275]|uniref:WDR89 family WD repeat protein n=1 Tax=Schizosaccharomyces japonicus (strain yFS275 / FY16936) TaxID=402676 RepID=B6K6A6_SCHJY|nr:WDR89 family WD repeat protein [Schizosaccharomyces japonicus yFS275]EEB09060.1 WDR89 family WD repeat protein [Schizosaccharomyces japonicus yFS275]